MTARAAGSSKPVGYEHEHPSATDRESVSLRLSEGAGVEQDAPDPRETNRDCDSQKDRASALQMIADGFWQSGNCAGLARH